jgi:hypothetical protein
MNDRLWVLLALVVLGAVQLGCAVLAAVWALPLLRSEGKDPRALIRIGLRSLIPVGLALVIAAAEVVIIRMLL